MPLREAPPFEDYMRPAYPARFHPAGVGYLVTFRDLPQAITRGDNRRDARAMAIDSLASAVEALLESGKPVPVPSSLQPGEELVRLPRRLAFIVAARAMAASLAGGSSLQPAGGT